MLLEHLEQGGIVSIEMGLKNIQSKENNNADTLRVIQVCDLQAGGIASIILSICERMDRDRVNFDYLVYRNQKEFFEDRALGLGGKKFIADNSEASNPLLKFFQKFFRTYRVLKNEKAKIFHVNASSPYECIVGFAARLAGVKTVILHSHNSRLKKNGTAYRLVQKICRLCMPLFGNHYFACSDLAGEFMYGKRREKKVVYVKNGIHTEKYRFNPDVRAQMRGQYDVEDALVIGSIGRMCRAKNQKFLLMIFAELLKLRPEARLLLIGKGELEAELMAYADSLGIREKLIHIPSTDRVQDYLCMIDVFLLPSLHEGLPVVGVEAQASGLPCVFSNRITKQTAITDLANFMSLEQTPSEWAELALSLAKSRDEKRCEYARLVREQGFNIEDTAKWLQNFYLSL